MLKHYLNKGWVQNLILLSILGLAVYYFGFLFHFDYQFNWAVLYSETEYGNMGDMLLHGLNLTVLISLYSAVIALTLGTLFGLARLSNFKPVYGFATVYVEFFRNTPLLVQLFFWNFALFDRRIDGGGGVQVFDRILVSGDLLVLRTHSVCTVRVWRPPRISKTRRQESETAHPAIRSVDGRAQGLKSCLSIDGQ